MQQAVQQTPAVQTAAGPSPAASQPTPQNTSQQTGGAKIKSKKWLWLIIIIAIIALGIGLYFWIF